MLSIMGSFHIQDLLYVHNRMYTERILNKI